jgi:RNA polymerase sigma-70 factor, ECF subfamily
MAKTRLAVTELLAKINAGDRAAVEQLMEELYPELKKVAARIFRNERRNHTLQPTALVNEAYLRVFGSQTIDWRDRAHFFAIMATHIRRLLVDHGRAWRAEKRGAGGVKIPLEDAHPTVPGISEKYVALDEALAALEQEDPRAARVVELRYFGGLTDAESAEVLGVAIPTVRRDWVWARSWLFDRLGPLASVFDTAHPS